MAKQKSVQQNMLYYTVGSIAYYAFIWALSVVVVRVSGYEIAGIFSLATSVTSAPAVVSLFNMRSYQVSDLQGEYSDKTYIASRWISNIASVLVCLVMILIGGYSFSKAAVIIAYMLVKVMEGFADVYYGIEQKWQRLDFAGISLLFRGLLCFAAFLVALMLTDNLLWAMLAMVAVSAVIILGMDVTIVKKYSRVYAEEKAEGEKCAEATESTGDGSPDPAAKSGTVWTLLWICLPLMAVAMLNNLSFTLPKIYLEKYHGETLMGIYSSVASPTLVVQLAAQTLFAPLIPPLTRLYNSGKKQEFYATIKRFSLMAAALVAVCLVASKLLAKPILVLIFGQSIADYTYLFIYVILIAVINAVASCLLCMCTLLRILRAQLLVGLAGIVSSFVFSVLFVQKWADELSMEGTILAIGGALLIQCIIQFVLVAVKLGKDWPTPPDADTPDRPWGESKDDGKKKVAVLLAAYNGEKFLKDQIESILAQETDNFEVKLYVRDDGSKDGTVALLKEYEAAGKLTLFTGANKGFAQNFLTVLSLCDEADYYAFSDQDDIWEPGKIARAVSYFRSLGEKNDKPQLYFANYEFYNEELTSHTPHGFGKLTPNFANAMVDCPALGCTQVFNHAARRSIMDNMPGHVVGHDCWTYMVCAGLGEAFCDSEYVAMKFRRHPGSASAEGMSFLLLQLWRVKIYFKNDRFSDIRKMLREFETFYAGELDGESQSLLALFTKDRYHISVANRKAFYPKRFRPRLSDEVLLRIIALIGKI